MSTRNVICLTLDIKSIFVRLLPVKGDWITTAIAQVDLADKLLKFAQSALWDARTSTASIRQKKLEKHEELMTDCKTNLLSEKIPRVIRNASEHGL